MYQWVKSTLAADWKTLLAGLLASFFPLFSLEASEDLLPSFERSPGEGRGDLRSDRYLLRNYTYNESPEIVELEKHGKPKKTQMIIYEVFSSTVQEISTTGLGREMGNPAQKPNCASKIANMRSTSPNTPRKPRNEACPFNQSWRQAKHKLSKSKSGPCIKFFNSTKSQFKAVTSSRDIRLSSWPSHLAPNSR